MSAPIVDRVAEVLLRYDPIGIYFPEHENKDEYVPEATDIAERLGHCTSREECLELIYTSFLRNFGAAVAGSSDRYADIASEVWELRKST